MHACGAARTHFFTDGCSRFVLVSGFCSACAAVNPEATQLGLAGGGLATGAPRERCGSALSARDTCTAAGEAAAARPSDEDGLQWLNAVTRPEQPRSVTTREPWKVGAKNCCNNMTCHSEMRTEVMAPTESAVARWAAARPPLLWPAPLQLLWPAPLQRVLCCAALGALPPPAPRRPCALRRRVLRCGGRDTRRLASDCLSGMTFGKLRASRKVKAFRKVAGRGELSRVCLAEAERCAARAVAVWAATAAQRGGTGERTGESARGSIGRRAVGARAHEYRRGQHAKRCKGAPDD